MRACRIAADAHRDARVLLRRTDRRRERHCDHASRVRRYRPAAGAARHREVGESTKRQRLAFTWLSAFARSRGALSGLRRKSQLVRPPRP